MPPRKQSVSASTAPRLPVPSWRVERSLHRDGHARVAGVDEVGRGPLAGPVVAAAVVLPERRVRWLSEVRDSKQLTRRQRERLAERLRRHCEWGIGVVSTQAIDQIGIGPATRLAMRRAVLALPRQPDALIVDGRERLEHAARQQPMVGADALCLSVAAASIIAKVARDAMMVELDGRLPGYGFARHVGYATAEHREALHRLGYSTAHRLTFAPVRRTLPARSRRGMARRASPSVVTRGAVAASATSPLRA